MTHIQAAMLAIEARNYQQSLIQQTLSSVHRQLDGPSTENLFDMRKFADASFAASVAAYWIGNVSDGAAFAFVAHLATAVSYAYDASSLDLLDDIVYHAGKAVQYAG